MSETIKPNESEVNTNLLTNSDVNTTINAPNNFETPKKFIITKCSYYIVLLNLISLIFYFLLIYFNSNLENLFINILSYVIIFLIQIYLNIRFLRRTPRIIELIKDVQNNKFEINSLNYFKKSISDEILELNSLKFYEINYKTVSEDDKVSKNYGLLILNTFPNKNTIDLDLSDIKNKPKKIYYLFDNGYNYNKQLYSFVGCSKDNPYFININEYMGKSKPINFSCFGKYRLSKYLKISDTFFAFFFEEKNNFCFILLFYLDIYIGAFGFIGIMIEYYSEVDTTTKIISIIIYIIFMIIFNFIYIYFLIKRLNSNIRIDIVYSNNFDRIFIGLVKYNEEAFTNTFLFEISSIEKFILEQIDKDKNKYTNKKNNLKVILKNGEIRTICQINENQGVLEGLIFILNEKLNNKNEQMTNNDNILVKNW